ncbi:GRIP/coiled-coil protein isoform X2 [Carex rostrata]
MENMRHRRGGARGGSVNIAHGESGLSKAVNSVFAFVRLAEFEILFVLFFIITFLIFKDLTSRPEYNDIFVKKPGKDGFWPYS